MLELLEGRVLLTYTFAYDSGSKVAVAAGSSGTYSLVIEPVNGFLEYSVDGGAFSGTWGSSQVPAASDVTVNITMSTGKGSSLQLGTAAGPASEINAKLNVEPEEGGVDSVDIDDSAGTTVATSADPYTVATGAGFVTGPGINYNEVGDSPCGGGVVLQGSALDGDTYIVKSTFAQAPTYYEPFTVLTGSSGTSTVEVGESGLLSNLKSPVSILSAGGTGVVTIDDANDTSHATATLDNNSGNTQTPYELTGLAPSAIEYGAGVTSLTIDGGSSAGGPSGITYSVNQTQAGTTTTLNGGPSENSFDLSNATLSGGLSNLPGPLVINGGTSLSDIIDLDDTGAATENSYTISGSSVLTSAGGFGGLNYGSVQTLDLTTEGSGSGNTIVVDGTADGVATTINSQDGTNALSIAQTGSSGSLTVDTTAVAMTTSILAASEPIVLNYGGPATVDIGSTGGAGSLASVQSTISIADPAAAYELALHDENDPSDRTWKLDANQSSDAATIDVSGAAQVSIATLNLASLTIAAGAGDDSFQVANTVSRIATTIDAGSGDDTVSVLATGGTSTLNIDGQGGVNAVNLGAGSSGAQTLTGAIDVSDSSGTTALRIDDSGDRSVTNPTLTDSTLTGLAPAAISYIAPSTSGGSGVVSLVAKGGSGDDVWTVLGTLANSASPINTTLDSGKGDSIVNVVTTSANGPLHVIGEGADDVVKVGQAGLLAGIDGAVSVNNLGGATALTIDGSAETSSHNVMLAGPPANSALDGLAPAPISYDARELSLLTIDTGPKGSQALNVNFIVGNPIPELSAIGLVFDAAAGTTNAANSHALNLLGMLPTGPFLTETTDAQGPTFSAAAGSGSIVFTAPGGASAGLDFSGLQSIDDTTAATEYSFNDEGYPDQSFAATNGTPVLGLNTIQLASTPTPSTPVNFATTTIANKTDILLNAPALSPGVPSNGLDGTVDIPTASTGLASLTFGTPTGGANHVSFVATPTGIPVALNGGTGSDNAAVTGTGVPTGSTLTFDGGAGTNVLAYDAGGLTPSLTAGAVAGEVVIALPGFGSVDAVNYSQIALVNVGAPTITPGAAETLNTVEGASNTNAIVGTFTFPLAPIVSAAAGLPATDFTASIDWGDPSPDPSGGTITQDASDPSVYYVTATHTFNTSGTFSVTSQLASAAASMTGALNGTPILLMFDPSGPVSGAPATANVAMGSLAVSVDPISGTEGTAIAAGPIATFTDGGGAHPISDYSASISIVDAAGKTVLSVQASSITQVGSSAQYIVNSPALILPEEGVYHVWASITRNEAGRSLTSAGSALVVIADAPLSAPLQTPVSVGVKGVAITERRTFTAALAFFDDGDPAATADDFTEVSINWGDGSPTTAGTIVAPEIAGQPFVVTGSHTYADSGVNAGHGIIPITIHVHDRGGAALTIQNIVIVADVPIHLTGSINPSSIAAETTMGGLSNGTIALGSTPGFSGHAEPGSSVVLTATRVGSGLPIVIGRATANSAGLWKLTSIPLPEGRYTISANATDRAGKTTATTRILPNSGQGPLVIDRTAPKVSNVIFNRRAGTIDVIYSDTGSGLNPGTILEPKNYALTRPQTGAGAYAITSVTQLGTPAGGQVEVVLRVNGGRPITGGIFTLVIDSATPLSPDGVKDRAGNALDGDFHGTFPSGNNIAGGNFAAQLLALRNQIVPAASSSRSTAVAKAVHDHAIAALVLKHGPHG
jgi:hypothetical protein